MARRPASRRGDHAVWNPGKYAVWSQRWVDAKDSAPTTILLRHPSAPFTGVVKDFRDQALRALAFAYLERATKLTDIQPRLEVPEEWLRALSSTKINPRLASAFGWLPIQWPPSNFEDEQTPAHPGIPVLVGPLFLGKKGTAAKTVILRGTGKK